jgi:hypothetical protein
LRRAVFHVSFCAFADGRSGRRGTLVVREKSRSGIGMRRFVGFGANDRFGASSMCPLLRIRRSPAMHAFHSATVSKVDLGRSSEAIRTVPSRNVTYVRHRTD